MMQAQGSLIDAEGFKEMPGKDPPAKRLTEKEGQYLAFIHYYSKINRRPPAEADMQAYFQVTAPTVHQMIDRLHRKGLIHRIPGTPRSIRVLLSRAELPDLE